MTDDKYKLSFSTGGLFHRESVILAELFLESNDWDSVRDSVLSENLLQTRTQASSKRSCREIISRLETLSHEELDLLVNGTFQEQAQLLWVAVCRLYKLIAEFAVEVIRERLLGLRFDLSYEDFDFFLNRKSEWHAELDELQPATRKKLRQVLFKILREADILSADNTINAVMLSPRVQDIISSRRPRDLTIFPVLDSELRSAH